jgi:hypothetical protein
MIFSPERAASAPGFPGPMRLPEAVFLPVVSNEHISYNVENAGASPAQEC